MLPQGYPERIHHWMNDEEMKPASGQYFKKMDPATGKKIVEVARGNAQDADTAMRTARAAFQAWSVMTPVARGNILRKAASLLSAKKALIGPMIALEGGQSSKQGQHEVEGAIEHMQFWASEGRRFYGTTMPSKTDDRLVYTLREPVGVVLVITPANTPFGGRAVMPALLAGNTVVMKPSEDTPTAAMELARAFKEAGLPSGVFTVVQGLGNEAGAALTAHEEVDVISFTGSVAVGKTIEKVATGRRDKFVRASLELGGKNPLVICDDADLPSAVKSATLSAFSLAGQRCAAASRIIVMDAVYDEVKRLLVERTKALKVGLGDADDMGPVVNERQLDTLLSAVKGAVSQGGAVLTGGDRLSGNAFGSGYFMAPTILEGVPADADISRQELFGPVTVLYRAKDFAQAMDIANDSPYGLTASVHTGGLHRAQEFIRRVRAGVVHVNGHTYGAEPHMPFGGYRNSGNGTREAGTGSLEVYTMIKTVTVTHDPART